MPGSHITFIVSNSVESFANDFWFNASQETAAYTVTIVGYVVRMKESAPAEKDEGFLFSRRIR